MGRLLLRQILSIAIGIHGFLFPRLRPSEPLDKMYSGAFYWTFCISILMAICYYGFLEHSSLVQHYLEEYAAFIYRLANRPIKDGGASFMIILPLITIALLSGWINHDRFCKSLPDRAYHRFRDALYLSVILPISWALISIGRQLASSSNSDMIRALWIIVLAYLCSHFSMFVVRATIVFTGTYGISRNKK